MFRDTPTITVETETLADSVAQLALNEPESKTEDPQLVESKTNDPPAKTQQMLDTLAELSLMRDNIDRLVDEQAMDEIYGSGTDAESKESDDDDDKHVPYGDSLEEAQVEQLVAMTDQTDDDGKSE